MSEIYTLLSLILSAFCALFLFWRAAKRELVEAQLIFDICAIFLLGAIFGRVSDFLVRQEYYNWSLAKLFFFNVTPGFDMYGAFLGGLVAVALFLRRRKQNFWFALDLATSGLVFGAFVFTMLNFLFGNFFGKSSNQSITFPILAFGYFVIFWALKRFEKKKKHRGFLACFCLTSFSLLNLTVIFIFFDKNLTISRYILILMTAIFIFCSVSWYLLAKRKIANDFKDLFASIMLSVFRMRRVLTNIREADNLAKTIVLSPLSLAKLAFYLVKYVGREFYISVVDLLSAFGVRR